MNRAHILVRLIPQGLAVFMAAVFLDSLRYKFTDHPNTQVIFGKLNAWAASIGADGLFGHTGLFSQYVIGLIELLASTLLIVGIAPRLRHLQAGGALAAILVMAGAVSFHTLTPLGVDPNNDGAGLFVAACINLGAAALMLAVFRRREFGQLLARAVEAMSEASWISDFSVSGREVLVKKTGAVVRIDRMLAGEAATWLGLYLAIKGKAALNRLLPPGPAVWFAPDKPRPWYLIWAAATWNGVRIARSPDEAHAWFYFENLTEAPPRRPMHSRAFNFGCADISKGRVARVFEQVFGYPLAIDPTGTAGVGVEKGEANGVHDGRLVSLPTPPRPGKVYQRLVDNIWDGQAVDLRTPIVGGRPVLVFIKRRHVTQRYANHNAAVSLKRPEEVFTASEIGKLATFARAMGLDWGGLDVLRDRASGRLYVVDVNKTDMGPPIALPFPHKIAAVARMGRALRRLIEEETPQ